jgi:hypothetical protein
LKRKWGFLCRSLNPSDTVAAVFFLHDRAVDFPAGRGFSFDLGLLLEQAGLPELINCVVKSDVYRAIDDDFRVLGSLLFFNLLGAFLALTF